MARVEGESELFGRGIDAADEVFAELKQAHDLRVCEVLDTGALSPLALEQNDQVGSWRADVEVERERAVLEESRAGKFLAVSTTWIVNGMKGC